MMRLLNIFQRKTQEVQVQITEEPEEEIITGQMLMEIALEHLYSKWHKFLMGKGMIFGVENIPGTDYQIGFIAKKYRITYFVQNRSGSRTRSEEQSEIVLLADQILLQSATN